jgi:hypothetical protein
VDDAPDCGECYLRLGPTANGQMKGVRWAREYQIR